MERVTGIGGFFFPAEDSDKPMDWYANGRFARLSDPEGNPIEVWEPAGPDLHRPD